MSQGRINKSKGSHGERFYARVFRDSGHLFCKTTRLASRMLDNCKIDLAFLPYNTQIKAGEHKNLHPGKVFARMERLLSECFPPLHEVHAKPYLLIHRPAPYAKGFTRDLLYITHQQHQSWEVETGRKLTIVKEKKRKDVGKYNHVVAILFSDFYQIVNPYYLNKT